MKSGPPPPSTVPPIEQAISVTLAIACGLLSAYLLAPYAKSQLTQHTSRGAFFFPFIIGAMFAYAGARFLLKLLRKQPNDEQRNRWVLLSKAHL